MDSEQFGQLMSGITRVETEQCALRRELLGNGQPGRIQILEGKISTVEKTADVLQADAGKLRWKLGTLSAVAGSVLAVAVQWFVKHFLHTQ
jgi:hypothetical protein